MPLRKAGKRANKAPKATELNVPDSTITLGKEEAPAAPTTLESVYPLCPLLSTPEHAAQEAQPTAAPLVPAAQQTQENATEKDEKLFWTEEMMEMLVDGLYEVFEKGGAADNSFKKATFEQVAEKVRKAYKGSIRVTQQHCKNKWADFKAKWSHWKFLGEQSGFGWNEELELYEAYDYVWNGLNNAHPGIIWHKTHIMPFRDSISMI